MLKPVLLIFILISGKNISSCIISLRTLPFHNLSIEKYYSQLQEKSMVASFYFYICCNNLQLIFVVDDDAKIILQWRKKKYQALTCFRSWI